MKAKKILFCIITFAAAVAGGSIQCHAQEDFVKPDETFLFAEKDSCQLYMDIYYPADGSVATVDGVSKPTIIYVFGGGFKGGRRDSRGAQRWFKLLADEGFTIAAIDYRLGLKNVSKMGLAQANLLYNAIKIAVEDLYSATDFILKNSEMLGIDPTSLVISGSSAGAITALQAEWELCNRSELASVLPEDFRYAGVMSFAGAVFSKHGKVRYKTEPAPTIMFHGTADKIVTYRQLRLFNQAFQGTGKLSREYKAKGYDCHIYRFEGNGHEIAGAMYRTFPEQLAWLEGNVIGKQRKTVDAKVNDPKIEKFQMTNVKDLYGGEVPTE